MRKRGTCCRPVSVWPSRSCIVSKRLKMSSKFIFVLVAPSFKFFEPKCRYPVPRGTPSAGALNARGAKNLRFSTEISVSRKRYEIGPWLMWNVNRKS